MFKYKLCSHPPALFDMNHLVRQPQKPVLADVIWSLLALDDTSIPDEVQYVLDGEVLVQHIVVFDGCGGTLTKDLTHQRQTKGKVGETVTFEEDMHIMMTKEQFLANNMSKQ